MELRTCRFCQKQDPTSDEVALNLFKYGTRSYAHADCLLTGKGEAGFSLLPEHELKRFPALVARKHGLLPALCRRLGVEWTDEILYQRLDACPDCAEGATEGCLRCDGTATICGVCGEAPAACGCPVARASAGDK